MLKEKGKWGGCRGRVTRGQAYTLQKASVFQLVCYVVYMTDGVKAGVNH